MAATSSSPAPISLTSSEALPLCPIENWLNCLRSAAPTSRSTPATYIEPYENGLHKTTNSRQPGVLTTDEIIQQSIRILENPGISINNTFEIKNLTSDLIKNTKDEKLLYLLTIATVITSVIALPLVAWKISKRAVTLASSIPLIISLWLWHIHAKNQKLTHYLDSLKHEANDIWILNKVNAALIRIQNENPDLFSNEIQQKIEAELKNKQAATSHHTTDCEGEILKWKLPPVWQSAAVLSCLPKNGLTDLRDRILTACGNENFQRLVFDSAVDAVHNGILHAVFLDIPDGYNIQCNIQSDNQTGEIKELKWVHGLAFHILHAENHPQDRQIQAIAFKIVNTIKIYIHFGVTLPINSSAANLHTQSTSNNENPIFAYYGTIIEGMPSPEP